MATTALDSGLPTLLDHLKRLAPNGAIARIVETMTKRTPLLQDMVVQEGNLPTGHRFTSRTALPTVGWRRFNEGVSPSKSKTDQVTETTGELNGFSVCDSEECNLSGNGPAFRASEDMAFMQALKQEVETAIFYSSTKTNPEKIEGFTPRLDSTSGTGGKQIIKHDASASGSDQTSIWLVGWGPDSVFSIYPKGAKGGIEPHPMPEQLWDDGTGKKFRAYVTNWVWKLGLCVKDYRQLVRICNIDTSNLAATGNTLIQSMIKAYHQMYDLSVVRPAWYCSRTIATYLHLQALDSVKNSTLTIENVGLQPVTKMLGIPIRQTDALDATESVVS